MPETVTDGPTFDMEREERLRWLRLEFVLGTPSAKTFDVAEMTVLRDDLSAMLDEITRLRKALHKAFKLALVDTRHANADGILREVESILAPIGQEITTRNRALKEATRA
jgi:hypothetical protein